MRTFAFLFFLAIAGSAFAARKGDLILGTFNGDSKAVRVEIARDLDETVTAISAYVRYPTPAEENWINQQRRLIDSATDPARSHQERQLYRSTPLQLAKLRALLDAIRSNLRCIIDSDTEQSEMVCWLKAALYLTDNTTLTDSVRYLVETGEIPKEALTLSLLGDTDGFAIDYREYGRGIIEFIVVPYMQRSAGGAL